MIDLLRWLPAPAEELLVGRRDQPTLKNTFSPLCRARIPPEFARSHLRATSGCSPHGVHCRLVTRHSFPLLLPDQPTFWDPPTLVGRKIGCWV